MNSPLMSLDIGLRRTGVALSESGIFARPLTVIESHPPHMAPMIGSVVTLLREHAVQTLVVGIPLSGSDSTTAQAEKVEGVLARLEAAIQSAALPVDIIRVSEFHSTKDAAALFPGTDPDSGAAAVLLQDFIDEQAV